MLISRRQINSRSFLVWYRRFTRVGFNPLLQVSSCPQVTEITVEDPLSFPFSYIQILLGLQNAAPFPPFLGRPLHRPSLFPPNTDPRLFSSLSADPLPPHTTPSLVPLLPKHALHPPSRHLAGLNHPGLGPSATQPRDVWSVAGPVLAPGCRCDEVVAPALWQLRVQPKRWMENWTVTNRCSWHITQARTTSPLPPGVSECRGRLKYVCRLIWTYTCVVYIVRVYT